MENKQWDVNMRWTIETVMQIDAKDEKEALKIAEQYELGHYQVKYPGDKVTVAKANVRKTIWGTKESKKKKV